MVPTQFFGQNAHFAVNLLAGLAAFAVFWLVFDAWLVRRGRLEAVTWVGFLVLAVGFVVSAATLQTTSPGLLAVSVSHVGVALRLIGYLLIAIGQILNPLQLRPHTEPLADKVDVPATPETPQAPASGGVMIGALTASKLIVLPLLPVAVAVLYLRRATKGLERHLRPVGIAFAWLGLYELLSDAVAWQGTNNPTLYRLVAADGPLWWAAQAALLIGAGLLGRWVWRYLTKRLFSQLFIVLVTSAVAIFFVSTVGFSFLLMRNIQSEALTELTTASHVLSYAITSRQTEAAAQANATGQNPQVVAGIMARDHGSLATALSGTLAAHQLSSLIITDNAGQVLLRAENPAHWGDSVSGDSLVGRALIGTAAQSVVVTPGVIAPSVTLVAASPVRNASGQIIGVVETGRALTGSFVDGIKASSGLDSTIYGGNVRAATTLTTADGTTRATGIKETSNSILTTVLTKGHDYSGPVTLQNRDYLAAYAPLKNADGKTVAMLVITRSQDALLGVAGRTIELTFVMAIVLLLVSILPVYLIARRLSEQMK